MWLSVAASALLVIVLMTQLPASGPSVVQRRQALLTYAAAIEPLAKEGGEVVVLGLKPGLTDISEGRFPRETLVRMAEAWVRVLARTSDAFAAVHAPAFLADAKQLYDRSLRLYVKAAQTLLAAARADGVRRSALVTRAGDFGRQADAAFDHAKSILDAQRRVLTK